MASLTSLTLTFMPASTVLDPETWELPLAGALETDPVEVDDDCRIMLTGDQAARRMTVLGPPQRGSMQAIPAAAWRARATGHHLRSASSWTASLYPVSPYRRLVSGSILPGRVLRWPTRTQSRPSLRADRYLYMVDLRSWKAAVLADIQLQQMRRCDAMKIPLPEG
jgi:hypothetical protein